MLEQVHTQLLGAWLLLVIHQLGVQDWRLACCTHAPQMLLPPASIISGPLTIILCLCIWQATNDQYLLGTARLADNMLDIYCVGTAVTICSSSTLLQPTAVDAGKLVGQPRPLGGVLNALETPRLHLQAGIYLIK